MVNAGVALEPGSQAVPKRAWVAEIEYMRAFAILGVLAIHSFGYFTHIEAPGSLRSVTAFVDAMASGSVPLFVFISGFVLTINRVYQRPYISFIADRAKNIVVPYLFISLLYLASYAAASRVIPKPSAIGHDLLVGRSAFHLYFIPIIMMLYLLYSLCVKVHTWLGKWSPYLSLGLAYVLQNLWIHQEFVFKYVSRPNALSSPYVATAIMFFQVFFYFILGIYVAQNLPTLRSRLEGADPRLLGAASLLGGFLLATEWLYGVDKYGTFFKIPLGYFVPSRLCMPIFHVFIFAALYRLGRYFVARDQSATAMFLRRTSTYSYSMYLVHVLFLEVLLKAMSRVHLGADRWLYYPVLFMGTLLASYQAVKWTRRVPFYNLLIGR